MLTLQFVSNEELKNLSSYAKLQKILNIVKEDKIVVLEGKLKKDEEVELIRLTMEEVNDNFRGIELQVWDSSKKERSFFENLRLKLASILVPEFNEGFTIIGPANIVKEIKKDPSKIQLVTQNSKKKKNGRK